ncbi:MAG: hypothetical protein NY202_01365 [Mollicutes bacterium UO1]
MFGTHQPIDYKEKKSKKKDNDYYLISKFKGAQAILDNSLVKLEAVN